MITPPIREPWMGDALCAQVGGDVWFPEPGNDAQARAARAVCRECPVTAECLTYALNHSQQHGIWGGLTTSQRQRLRRGRAA